MATQNKANGSKGGVTEGHAVAIGVGIAALAAAAAGAYYLYGSDEGAKRRQKMKSWMLRMKAEVMEEIENLKEVNKEAYEATITTIADKYRQFKDIDPAEVAALAGRMKTHWKDIQRDINQTTMTTKSRVRKVVGSTKKRTPAKKRVSSKK